MKRILIFAGPSGGHLFPALAFAEAVKRKYPAWAVEIVATEKAAPFLAAWLLVESNKVHYLPAFPFDWLLSPKIFRFFMNLGKAFSVSARIFRDFKPDAVAVFGSYVSFPGAVLGKIKKVPVLLHEQNLELGKATRAMLLFADLVAVSFPGTLEKLGRCRARGVWTGNILKKRIYDKAREAKRNGDKIRLLVFGGSQGARFINSLILETFRLFSSEERKKIAVVHLTGTQEFPVLEHSYDQLGIDSVIFPYSDEMPELYAASDLVICRAGGGAIAEILLFGLPAIFIPFPHASGHQSENARYLAEKQAALAFEQSEIDGQKLKEIILRLIHSPRELARMGQAAAGLAVKDADDLLVKELVRLTGE